MNEEVLKSVVDKLSARLSRIEFMFEENRKKDSLAIADLQKRLDSIEHPDYQLNIAKQWIMRQKNENTNNGS